MRRRIVEWAVRPELWLCLLLFWIEASALRSLHTDYARVAFTEALRWSVGLLVALTLAIGLRRTGWMAQALTGALALLVAAALAAGRPQGMITGPYGDHQLCASALLALLPFSMALALAAPRPAWKWCGQIVTLAALVCLALTETRSAWIGALIGSGVFAWLWLRRFQPKQQTRAQLLMPLLMAGALAVAFLLMVHGSGLSHPLTARAATFRSLSKDGSWQWRLQTWRGTLHMISARPALGWGLGHYPAEHWQFVHLDQPLLPNERPSLTDQAHDFYLQTASEIGLIGMALYLGMILSTVRLMWKTLAGRTFRFKRDPRTAMRDSLVVAALSLLAAQAVDAVSSPSWQFAEVSLLFWLGLGVGLAACRPVVSASDEAVIPARVQQRLQYCAAGLIAVMLTAQVLPVGLLSPVEAYTYTSSDPGTFASGSVMPTSTSITLLRTGSSLQLSINVVYDNNNVMTTYQANQADVIYKSVTGGSAIDSITPSGLLVLHSSDANSNLTITAVYTDSQGPHTIISSFHVA